jgi:hypothetical protein
MSSVIYASQLAFSAIESLFFFNGRKEPLAGITLQGVRDKTSYLEG